MKVAIKKVNGYEHVRFIEQNFPKEDVLNFIVYA